MHYTLNAKRYKQIEPSIMRVLRDLKQIVFFHEPS
jgi:hypothetical protein